MFLQQGIVTYGKPASITLDTANRLIRERSKVVYGVNFPEYAWTQDRSDGKESYPADTHQALLICVEEIEKEDSAEKILNDWISHDCSENRWEIDIKERARKLLSCWRRNDRI